MKKILKLLAVICLMFVTMQVPVAAESLQDNLVPQDRDTQRVGEVELEYNEHPQHHYELDTYIDTSGDWMPWNWMDGAGNQIYIALMEMVNAIWMLNNLLANFTMVIVQEAFALDFVSSVIDQIGAAISSIAGFNSNGFMGNGLWPLLITFIICMVGAWAAYVGMIKRESSRAWGGIISALIIFVFSMGFFANSAKFLGGINEWSSELQSNILGVSAGIVNPGSGYSKDEGLATIRNQMFDLMVKKPYLLMQYGTTQIDSNRVNQILEVDPILNPEDREELVKAEVERNENTMMSASGIKQRAAFVPLLFIANTIIGVFLLLISGTIILYQLIFLVLALFAPVPLLMALIPSWKQTALNWIMKLVHAQIMKIAIALLLTILFGVSAILYRATESSDLGYLGMMLLQIICFVGVWAKRKDLFGMVSTAASNIQSSTGQTLNNYRNRFNQAKNNLRRGKELMNGEKSPLPLANRKTGLKPQPHIGKLDEQQLAERKKALGETKDRISAAGRSMTLANRSDQEFQEGKETYKNQLHNRPDIANAPTNQEELMDRQIDSNSQDKSNDNVTNIDDLRRRRMGSGNTIPLVNRYPEKPADKETASTLEGMDINDRQQSERNVNHQNMREHTDNIQEKQQSNLAERRTLHNDTDKQTAQEVINRNQSTHDNDVKNIQNTVNRDRITQESNVSNETVNRNLMNNENTQRNISETVNRQITNNEQINQNFNETVNRNITNNESTQRNINETFNRNHITNENNASTQQTTSNGARRVSKMTAEAIQTIINRAKNDDKPLTKWEAEQVAEWRKKQGNQENEGGN
ncbi:conjugal transfer protein [Cytobacillus sp. FSL R5-0569]|uniref:CD3337/EF1877 family mobilome membrane protein n=1 Tax=Cytobacillus sp. FSL R5-0569 TaxID=2921649 RepID=UPI0030F765C4